MGVVYVKADDSLRHLLAWEGLLDGCCYVLGKDLHTAYLLVGEVKEVVDLALGHYQGVAGLDGVDVKEGVELVILGALVTGNLSLYDSGE